MTTINEEMKLAASAAIASVVSPQELNKLYIIPSVFNQKVVRRIREAVILAALETGVARRIPREFGHQSKRPGMYTQKTIRKEV